MCPLPSSSLSAAVSRVQDVGTGSRLWRVYTAYGAHRIDRCFYESTYGGDAFAKAEAYAWRDAILTALQEALAGDASLPDCKKRLAEVNARFDARRPRTVCLSVWMANLNGAPAQYRALVSDRGQTLQRKELAANFQAVSKSAALDTLRQKIHRQIATFFDAAVADAFMAKHGRKLHSGRFQQGGTLEIRERADALLPAGAMPSPAPIEAAT